MATFATLEKITNSLAEVTVEPHFENISFRIKKKKFATHSEINNSVNVKLAVADQEHFSSQSPHIYPVNNKWAKYGWTTIEMNEVAEDVLSDIITTAYDEVRQKR